MVDLVKEEQKWKRWKLEEEKLLREFGVPEESILALRRMDWIAFISDFCTLERQTL